MLWAPLAPATVKVAAAVAPLPTMAVAALVSLLPEQLSAVSSAQAAESASLAVVAALVLPLATMTVPAAMTISAPMTVAAPMTVPAPMTVAAPMRWCHPISDGATSCQHHMTPGTRPSLTPLLRRQLARTLPTNRPSRRALIPRLV